MTTWIRRGVILAALALVVAALAVYVSTRTENAPPADGGTADDGGVAQERTGKALGLMLGLEPVAYSEVKGDCWAWAEYNNHRGFCMDSVVSTKVAAAILGRQINGHHVSDAERKYFELQYHVQHLENSGKGTKAEIQQLEDQLWEMKKSLN